MIGKLFMVRCLVLKNTSLVPKAGPWTARSVITSDPIGSEVVVVFSSLTTCPYVSLSPGEGPVLPLSVGLRGGCVPMPLPATAGSASDGSLLRGTPLMDLRGVRDPTDPVGNFRPPIHLTYLLHIMKIALFLLIHLLTTTTDKSPHFHIQYSNQSQLHCAITKHTDSKALPR